MGNHGALLVGAGILTWEAIAVGGAAVTAVSQWGAAHMAVGIGIDKALTIGATALEIVGVRAPDAPPKHRGHGLVVDAIIGDRVYIRDPYPGHDGSAYTVPVHVFLDYWKGTALVVKP